MALHKETSRKPVVLEWQRCAVDAGNRVITSASGDNTISSMPSVHLDLNPNDDPPKNPIDSAVIHYYSSNPDLKDQRWVTGQLAVEMGGYPTYQGEKADLSLKLCLAGLKLPEGYRQCQIKKLTVCTPNQLATEKIVRMKDALRGVHSFERNELALTINIYEVECQPETLGAWRYAMAHSLYKWKRPNAILDLGGKTGIGQVYMPSGMAPVDGRVIVSGTYDLAKLIAAEDKQLAALDTSADLGKIMDAIADGSYTYATFEQSIFFAETFHTCLYKWITSIRDRLKTQWQKYLPQLGEVLIIGGSAPLANELVLKTNGRFKVAENHKTINVQGMLIDG